MINGSHVIIATKNHNHMADPLRLETSRYREALKRKASQGDERPEKIIRRTASQFPVEVNQQAECVCYIFNCHHVLGSNDGIENGPATTLPAPTKFCCLAQRSYGF